MMLDMLMSNPNLTLTCSGTALVATERQDLPIGAQTSDATKEQAGAHMEKSTDS